MNRRWSWVLWPLVALLLLLAWKGSPPTQGVPGPVDRRAPDDASAPPTAESAAPPAAEPQPAGVASVDSTATPEDRLEALLAGIDDPDQR